APSSAHVAADRGSPSPASSARGIAPTWFWIGAGLTVALAAGTTASGVDTLAKHNDYLGTRDAAGYDAGRAAQTRTNVLLVSTGVVGVVTVALGLFAVRWSNPHARASSGSSPFARTMANRTGTTP